MKWFICSGKNVCLALFLRIFVPNKISCIWTVRMFSTQKWLKSSMIFWMRRQKNYVQLRNNFSQFENVFQYVYSNFYPEVYCATERRSFDLKSTFHIVFKAYKDKKSSIFWKKSSKLSSREEWNLHVWTKTEKIVKERMEQCKIKKKDVAKKVSSWKKEKSGAGQNNQKANMGQVERTQQKFYGR